MESFKYEKRYWYPHMGPLDIKLWERFIDRNPGRFDVCIYDLPVGAGAETPGVDAGDPMRWNEYLTKYKCDVIAFKGDEITIIELKPRADMRSFGQLRGYRLVYQEYVDRKAWPDLLLVTDELRSDMDWMAEEEGVKLEIV